LACFGHLGSPINFGNGFDDLEHENELLMINIQARVSTYTDGDGLTHITDGETAKRRILGESLNAHGL